ncbi:uncharacterized protein LOC110761322 [Prunus avium]|uniref:Uncharacterized protein LOC110761322 n=1 Tax=Prunus avium TaxID=42229 RepID=A0A6P5STC7_PRUAV|nr:uncharacterized protein LOC110761322 [Prunus avium]
MILLSSTLLRTLHLPSSSATQMARYIPRATLLSITPIPIRHTAASFPAPPHSIFPLKTQRFYSSKSSLFGWRFHSLCGDEWRGAARPPLLSGPIYSSQREYRKMRRRATKTKEKEKKEIELDVSICIEEDLPDDPEVLWSLKFAEYCGIASSQRSIGDEASF